MQGSALVRPEDRGPMASRTPSRLACSPSRGCGLRRPPGPPGWRRRPVSRSTRTAAGDPVL